MSDNIVGSAAFELRASRDKIQGDMEQAQREIEAAAKRTEASLAEIVGTGTEKGSRRAAGALKEPQAAGVAAGAAISDAMKKAGEETGNSITAGARKAKAELDALAAKARSVQKVWVPDDAFRQATNIPNGAALLTKTPRTGTLGAFGEAKRYDLIGKDLDGIANSSKNAAAGLGQVRSSSGLAAAALGGVATAAAGISFGAILGAARDAARFGAEITKTSESLGIGVVRLQELRFAASETSVPIANLEAGLGKLNVLLGQFQAGTASRDLKPIFDKLGIKPEDLKTIENADQFLALIADRIRSVSTEAEQAAIMDKLQIRDLLPMAQLGAKGIAELSDSAHELGGVLDEDMVKKLAAADAAMERSLGQINNLRIAAFAPLAVAIGDASQQATGFITEMENIRAKAPTWQRVLSGIIGALPGGPFVRSAFERAMGQVNPDRPASDNIWNFKPKSLPDAENTIGGYAPRTPRKARDNSAALAAREARREERVEQEIFKARQRLLGIVDKETMTVQERFDLARKQTALDRQAEATELKSRLARKDLKDEEYKILVDVRKQTAIQQDIVAKKVLERDLQDERIANERLLTKLSSDLLTLQSGAARTAGERKAIEHRLLAISQKDARDALEARLRDTPGLSEDDKKKQREELARVHKAQSDAVDRSNLTPLEAWRDAALKNAAEVRQAYEGVAANGLDALNSGIVDAIMNTRSLGDVFSNVAKQIIADLASIEIRRSITEPLSRMLFSGGSSPLGDAKAAARAAKGLGGESGGWLSKIFGAGKSFFGFSSGGYTGDGGKYDPAGLVHKGEYVLPQETVSRIGVSRLDALRAGAFPGFADGGLVGMPAMPSMSVGGLGAGNLARPQKLFVQIDFNDPMFRARVRNEAMPLVAQGAAATYEATKADTMETLASQQTYTRR